MARGKFAAAEAASDTIVDAMDRAGSALSVGSRPFNGFGILYDPSLIYGQLHDAKVAIDKAIAAYKATTWTTRSDYDAAEGGR